MRKLILTRKALNRVAAALAVIFCVNGMVMAARAEKGDWHDHARAAHEWRHNHWRNGHIIYGGGEPYVTYAPPLVVEPPPPAYYAPQPGVSIVVPLNFR